METNPETLDSICAGKVQIIQRKAGYRFNLDPILLSYFGISAAQSPRGGIVDLGTGTGIIPLVLARRFGLKRITGLEIQASLFELAQRNVRLNRAERAVSLVLGDIRRISTFFSAGDFSQVYCNPPYTLAGAGRLNPASEKAVARHEILCSLSDVAHAASYLLNHRGSLFMIYPTSRVVDLLCTLREHRLEPRRMRLVHPRPKAPANRVLVEAVRAAGAELTVEPPLYLHGATGNAFSREVRQMVSGSSSNGRRTRSRNPELR